MNCSQLALVKNKKAISTFRTKTAEELFINAMFVSMKFVLSLMTTPSKTIRRLHKKITNLLDENRFNQRFRPGKSC